MFVKGARNEGLGTNFAIGENRRDDPKDDFEGTELFRGFVCTPSNVPLQTLFTTGAGQRELTPQLHWHLPLDTSADSISLPSVLPALSSNREGISIGVAIYLNRGDPEHSLAGLS